MKTVMISMPMRGKDTADVRKEWQAIADKLAARGYKVVDTVFDWGPGVRPLTCLARAIEFMALTDAVYFAKGFEAARGCVAEWYCATQYGKEVIYGGDDD